jgi:hypothetical protein
MLSFRIVKKADHNLPFSIATRKKRGSVLLTALASTAFSSLHICFEFVFG